MPLQEKYLCAGMKECLTKFCGPLVSQQPCHSSIPSASEQETEDTVLLSLTGNLRAARGTMRTCGSVGSERNHVSEWLRPGTSGSSNWYRSICSISWKYEKYLGRWGFYESLNFLCEYIRLGGKWDSRINVSVAKTWGHESHKIPNQRM